MYSPVRVSSRARASGIRLLRNTPPPAAIRDRFTSGSPSLASSATTARSQLRSSSNPPATAVAGAGDHDRADRRVPLGRAERRTQRAHQLRVEGVARVGAVEAQDADGTS